MANYVRASTDPASVDKCLSADDEDVNTFQVRGQLDFQPEAPTWLAALLAELGPPFLENIIAEY